MKLKVTKVYHGIIDTQTERDRINEAFADDPETHQHLLELMDAIEAGQWEQAQKMLKGEWWTSTDKDIGCPRIEFIGLIKAEDPDFPDRPASGFSITSSYDDLVYSMAEQVLASSSGCKDARIMVQKIS